MQVIPKRNFKLLGTSVVLDASKTYTATLATNQPNWEVEGKIFVEGVLLCKGDYDVIRARS